MSGQRGSAGGPSHILLVCASEMLICGFTELLASAGYHVTGSPDAWRARKLVHSRRFALALLDLPADDEPARELVRLLRQGGARIKHLVFRLADRTMTSRSIEVDRIPVKPLPEGYLLDTVARLIGPPQGPPDLGGGKPNAA